ncbi:MAG: twin-arginine translocation signal domain-containing protein [Caldilinea sp.]|nr:twin-arginine translocation signal domain-containing protein [Caldilinea sp.]
MTNAQSGPSMSRRTLLKLSGAAGVAAVGGYALFEGAPWLNVEPQAELVRRPLAEAPTATTALRELVRFATLAANGHNTQPWLFAIRDSSIEIHPDTSRRLAVVDPDDRELWISLGCALENLRLAAQAAGYLPAITYPEQADFIRVDLAPDRPQPGALFDAIPRRQSTRCVYDGQPVATTTHDQLQAVELEPGVSVRLISDRTGMETALEYVNQGNLAQYADARFVGELVHWLRFNKREALASLDGLYTRASGNPEVPRWLGQFFVTRTKPQQQADADATKLRSSPSAIVIASSTENRAAWVRTGQVYERLALHLAALDIKSALLNQPIEVAGLRTQFQQAMGLGTDQPQLLLRFGYAKAMPRSVRRPVEQVLVQA